MGKLSDEEQAKLDELLSLRDAPDEPDEDFEIEIYSGDKGARVPFSRGKSWLRDTFGIDIGDAPTEPKEPKTGSKGGSKAKDGKSEGDGEGEETGALRHFRQPRQTKAS